MGNSVAAATNNFLIPSGWGSLVAGVMTLVILAVLLWLAIRLFELTTRR